MGMIDSALKRSSPAALSLLRLARQGDFFMPALNQGEEAVLYCFIFLFLATAGGGPWSIDARLARK
jgi:uncharacterized membrane protein YphA (DoxX/SURF4 family)